MAIEDLAQLIGKVGEPTILEVEKGAIKRYASAVDDPNPLYSDDEYARNSHFGSIIAPQGFFGWPIKPGPALNPLMLELFDAIAKEGFSRGLDGGVEYEFFYPVRAGDVLVSYSKIADITVRDGKAGKMIMATTEVSYLNQNGVLVTKARHTSIRRQ